MKGSPSDDILKQEVLLSNFDGRDRVSVSEFIGYAAMQIAEEHFRWGMKLAKVGGADALRRKN